MRDGILFANMIVFNGEISEETMTCLPHRGNLGGTLDHHRVSKKFFLSIFLHGPGKVIELFWKHVLILSPSSLISLFPSLKDS